jgi:GNAT superfamily N-acetyltransferase
MATDTVHVRRVTDVPWTDAQRVFGTRGDPAGCWCQFFKLSNAQFEVIDRVACAAMLLGQVRKSQEEATPPPGLVAYLGDEPVGWVAVEPRPNYPTAVRGRVVTTGSAEAIDDGSVWAIVCFVVRVGYRRRGVARALLAAAVDHARSSGARVIEGYPVEVAKPEKVSSAALYHGTVSLFEAAGFVVTARPLPGRAVVTFTA